MSQVAELALNMVIQDSRDEVQVFLKTDNSKALLLFFLTIERRRYQHWLIHMQKSSITSLVKDRYFQVTYVNIFKDRIERGIIK